MCFSECLFVASSVSSSQGLSLYIFLFLSLSLSLFLFLSFSLSTTVPFEFFFFSDTFFGQNLHIRRLAFLSPSKVTHRFKDWEKECMRDSERQNREGVCVYWSVSVLFYMGDWKWMREEGREEKWERGGRVAAEMFVVKTSVFYVSWVWLLYFSGRCFRGEEKKANYASENRSKFQQQQLQQQQQNHFISKVNKINRSFSFALFLRKCYFGNKLKLQMLQLTLSTSASWPK